jgi:N12 class adenine-specific DNA methylase/tRNA1(Val) A37 N6-methylase TrmN6
MSTPASCFLNVHVAERNLLLDRAEVLISEGVTEKNALIKVTEERIHELTTRVKEIEDHVIDAWKAKRPDDAEGVRFKRIKDDARYLKDFVYSLNQLDGMTDKAQLLLSSDLAKSGRDTLLMAAHGIDRGYAHDINNGLDVHEPAKLRQIDMQDAFDIFPGLRGMIDGAIEKANLRADEKKNAAPEKEYRYAMFNRPAGIGAVPRDGFVRSEPRPNSGDEHYDYARNGIAVFNRKLTDEETKNFEMAPMVDVADRVEIASVVAADMADYGKEYVEMYATDRTDFNQRVSSGLKDTSKGYRPSVGSIDSFAKLVHAELERMVGKGQAAPEKVEAVPLNDIEKAQADLDAALGDFGEIFGSGARLNIITPEQQNKLIPVLTRIMDAAFRLGYHKFKNASKFVLDTIRAKFGDEVADQVSIDHLQGAYIGMAGSYKDQGADSKKDVAAYESIEELLSDQKAATDADAKKPDEISPKLESDTTTNEATSNDPTQQGSAPTLDSGVAEVRPGNEAEIAGVTAADGAGQGQIDDGNIRGDGGRGGIQDTESQERDTAERDSSVDQHGTPGELARGAGSVSTHPDFIPERGGLTREGSWYDTAKRNIDLIELALRIDAEGRAATPEEQSQLSKYVGFGASEIRNQLFPIPPEYAKRANPNRLIWSDYARDVRWKALGERLEALPIEWQKSVLQSTQYAHYTSEGIVRSVWGALERLGFAGGQVFEPGMGIGSFAMLMPDTVRQASRYSGVEFDGPTALIARLLSPQQNIMHDDFIKRQFPKDFYDVAIGNPPFSQTQIFGDPAYQKHGFMLHDFFFAKSMDSVRPGGLLVFVTSKGTMDKQTDKARKYLSARADLVGAIRLPSTAFEDNAGTSVVTDVIFMRKRMPGEVAGGQDWGKVTPIDTKDGQVVVNEYFAAHPEMVLGQQRISGNTDDQGRRINSNGRGGEKYTVVSYDTTPAELDAKFAEAVQRLPANVYSIMDRPVADIKAETAKIDFNPSVIREGVIYVAKDGTIMKVEQGVGRPLDGNVKLTDKDKVWLKDYVGLRNLIQDARQAQVTDGNWEAALKKLNKAYDAFRKTHGPIMDFTPRSRKTTDKEGNVKESTWRDFKNKRLYSEDYDQAIVRQLELVNDDGTITKGPFLTGRTIGLPVVRDVRSAGDALAVSLDELGTLNLADIGRRLNLSPAETLEVLGGQVYRTPGGEWQLADEYLSGNVVVKLEEAEQAARLNDAFARNVDALKAVQPEKLGPSQISAKLGAPWVPVEFVNEFAAEIEAGMVSFDPITESWQVEGGNQRSGRKAGAEYGTARRSPSELLEAALNSRQVRIVDKDINGKMVVDQDGTTAANVALKKIKDKFKSWIWTDSDRAASLVEAYNHRYNNIAPRRFDGSHLTLPGVSLRFKLHPHQLRAIWRVIQTGNTYLAHSVGSGKTIEMIAAGMEQKRLGLIKKPIYVVPNHMLEQFSNEFMELYPLANIMVADDQNFSADKRRAFVGAATMNNPDAVIITHDAFQRIGVKEESVGPIRDEIITDLELELASVAKDQSARVRRGQLEQQIEAVNQRFDRIINAGGKDSTIKFEDIGVDFVFFDEAHAARKLDFHTAQQIKGIDPNGSKRAMDMYIKTRWLESQRPGRSMVFASGTPVTNTMGELYTIMRFFAQEELDRAGISTFDSWSRMFGEVASALEPNAAGKYELIERFAKFDNVPELMARVRQFMDVLTSEHLGALVKRPDIIGGKPNLNIIEPTEALTDHMKGELARRIEESKAWKPSPDQPNNPDPIVAIITDGRFAAIDPRFFGAALPEGAESIITTMGKKVVTNYHTTSRNIYTDENGKPETTKGGTQMVFYNLGFGGQAEKTRGFNARAAFVKVLVDGGIPRDQIAWFDEATTDAKKEAIFKAMRSGKLRVLIGSAKKMGTGVNVQKRLTHLHYQDPPWFPSDVEQPHGRIIRQGNENPEVGIDWYTTKGTYQSTMWQMVARKQRFIDQAFSGDKSMRSMEDMGEASLFEQAAAVASGDPRALQLAGLRQDVERFERLQAAHASEQINARSSLFSVQWQLEQSTKRIERLTRAYKAIGERHFSFVTGKVGSAVYEKTGEFGAAIKQTFNQRAIDAVLNPSLSEDTAIANLGDAVTVVMEGKTDGKDKFTGTFDIAVKVASMRIPIFDYLAASLGDSVDAVGLVRRIVNTINSIDQSLREAQQKLTEQNTDIRKLTKKIGAPFEYQQELAEKYGDLKRLEDELKAEGAAPAPLPIVITEDGAVAQDIPKFSQSTTTTSNPHSRESLVAEIDKLEGAGFAERLEATGNFKIIGSDEVEGILSGGEMFSKGEIDGQIDTRLVPQAEAKELDAGETVTLYRAMSMIDGKLYPPMSAKMSDENGKLALRAPEPVGQWMRSEERSDLVPTEGRYAGQFPLKKPDGGTTWALYAPYFHASPVPLNDQFTAAWKNDGVERAQLVTVEVEVPVSELTSGYQAKGSVKKTGPNKWNSGVVASKVPGGREVVLSRYVRIKRVVPDAEVAQKIAAIVNPNRLRIPENTVTPQLRAELEKNGVLIAPKGTKGEDIRYSKDGRILAFVKDGVVHLVADNISKTDDNVEGLLLHEVAAHALQMGKDDAEFQSILSHVDRLFNMGDKQVVAARDRVPEDTPGHLISEENLGYLLESNPNHSLSKRFLSWIRAQIRNLAGKLKGVERLKFVQWATALTVDDLVWMANKALKSAPETLGKAKRDGTFKSGETGNTITIDGVKRPTTNSKGQPIHPTEEGIRNFYAWFGDSAVVDDQGRPLVVYHGTKADFTEFDPDRAGQNFDDPDERGMLFSSKETEPNLMADGTGGNVMPVYLSLQSPVKVMVNTEKAIRRFGVVSATTWYDNNKAEILQNVDDSDADGVIIESPEYKGYKAASTYVAFDPTQIKSAIGNNGDFSPTNPDIRYSRAAQSSLPGIPTQPPVVPPIQATMRFKGGAGGSRASWNAIEPSRFDDFQYKYVDKFIDLKRAVNTIKKTGATIQDKWNAYLSEELFHNRASKRVEDFVDRELNPVLKRMKEAGIDQDDLGVYLWARHAEEANALVAQRDPQVQDGGSGLTNNQAEDLLAGIDVYAHGKTIKGVDQATLAEMKAIAADVDVIIGRTRETYVAYGLENRDTVNEWAAMFKHYVPLMRDDHETGMGIGQGFSIKGRETKHRTGSNKEVVDILANIAMQREKAIVRGEKNRVAVSLAGLVKMNPNPDFWTLDKIPHEVIFNPKTGLNETREVPNYRNRDNVIIAKIKDNKGRVRERAIVLDEHNPRSKRLAAALKNIDVAPLEGVMGVSAKITRYFAAINTQYNPVFGAINLIRDVQTAMLNLGSTPLAGKQKQVMRLVGSALKGIYSDVRSDRQGIAGTSQWEQDWERFNLAGGATGFRDQFRTSEDRAREIESVLNPDAWMDTGPGKFFTAGGLLREPISLASPMARFVFNLLEDYNIAMENAVRLSAFRVAVDMYVTENLAKGMTQAEATADAEPKAASIAKNLTVNFNRKGVRTQQIGALYAFFNASVQGTARMMDSLVTVEDGDIKTIKMTKLGKQIIYGGVLLGAIQAVALAAAGFDDDEPPEFIKEKNLIIPLFGALDGRKYIAIPMPLGFHVIPNIGRIAAEFAMGNDKSTAELTIGTLGLVLNSYNPIGGSGLSLQTIMPTPLDPMAAIAENKDWTGKPIAKEDFSALVETPGHTRAKQVASYPSILAAETINFISGGDQYVPGILSPTPDQIDYLWAQVTGGVGRELGKLATTATAVMTGEDLPSHKVPLFGRLYGDADSQSSQSSKFYANLKSLNRHELSYKGMLEDRNSAGASEYLNNNPEARLIQIANSTERMVSSMNKRKRALIAADADRDQIRAIEKLISLQMMQFNQRVEALKEAG